MKEKEEIRNLKNELLRSVLSKDEDKINKAKEALKSKVEEIKSEKQWTITTPWMELIRNAGSQSPPRFATGSLNSRGSFADAIETRLFEECGLEEKVDTSSPLSSKFLDTALEKAVENLHRNTSLNKSDIQGEILQRLGDNKTAKRTALSAVRFLRDVSESWFTECEFCGHDNDPPWDVCEHCNKPRG